MCTFAGVYACTSSRECQIHAEIAISYDWVASSEPDLEQLINSQSAFVTGSISLMRTRFAPFFLPWNKQTYDSVTDAAVETIAPPNTPKLMTADDTGTDFSTLDPRTTIHFTWEFGRFARNPTGANPITDLSLQWIAYAYGSYVSTITEAYAAEDDVVAWSTLLTSNTLYDFEMRVVDGEGNWSHRSNIISARTWPGVPVPNA